MKGNVLKRTVWVLLAVIVLLCGTTYALMFRQTNLLENQFDTGRVDCEVHEELDNAGDYTQGVQNAGSKTGITVKNTGTIDAYIRLRFVSCWIDDDGNIVAKASQMPDIFITDHWIAGSGNTYYCRQAVAPGAFTAELLDAPIVLETSDGYRQVVEVFADAIQSLPEKAAEDSWQVSIEDGEITSAP